MEEKVSWKLRPELTAELPQEKWTIEKKFPKRKHEKSEDEIF